MEGLEGADRTFLQDGALTEKSRNLRNQVVVVFPLGNLPFSELLN